MRIAVVVSGREGENTKLKEIGKAIDSALTGRGYSVELINTTLDADKKLILFDYLVFVSETASFFSKKIVDSLGAYLKNCGNISGKRCAAVLRGSTVFKMGAMSELMRIVESEGVVLTTSQIVSSSGDAAAFAGSINVERNF